MKLQPQPAKVLEVLASRSGEVVSREEIRQLVWGDAFVDFDASLNFCIKEIRRALGDSASSPRFVETVPRRGYRFLRPVRTDEEAPEPPQASPPPPPAPPRRRWSGLGAAGTAVGLLILLTFLLGSRLHPPRPPVVPPEERLSSSEPANEAYRQGIYFLEREEYEKAEARFRDATLLDKDFASAHARIALARLKRMHGSVDPEVTETAARQAIELDPNLAEAHAALGQILFRRHFDWDGAGREFEKALGLEPRNAEIHLDYSFYLQALGHAGAIAAVKRARELDPGSMMTRSNYAWYLYLDRQYEEAIRQARSALELYPLSAKTAPKEALMSMYACQDTIIFSSLMLDDQETALAAAKAGLEVLALSEPVTQPRDLAEFFRGREQRLQKVMNAAPMDPYFLARTAMVLGERDRALDLLSRCAPKGSLAFPFAGVEPVFDELHGDPRWSKVLDNCLKLPADAR